MKFKKIRSFILEDGKRIKRYNKNNLKSACRAALTNIAGTDHLAYVFATAYGFVIDNKPPPQSHYIVHSSRVIELMEIDYS